MTPDPDDDAARGRERGPPMTTKLIEDGRFVPFRVELDESSGPTSPRFQYTLTVAVWCDGGPVHAVREERSGSPRRKIHAAGELSHEAARKLVETLEAKNALSRGFDHVGEAHENKDLSCNRLVIQVGEARAEVHYLLRTLEKAKHAAEAEIVKAIKEAAATLPVAE
jgi:hypothetical protein